jgi:deoxyribodipyrimidine photolyase-related protein
VLFQTQGSTTSVQVVYGYRKKGGAVVFAETGSVDNKYLYVAYVFSEGLVEGLREVFIDASEWVMVPNVIGMGVHADGGKMMTKPYAAGGAYISRMSNYCKGCAYDPKLRVGESACPFTTLYWDFLDRHKETFSKNHRMSQQIFGINRLSDLPELKVRAQEVLKGLDEGKI